MHSKPTTERVISFMPRLGGVLAQEGLFLDFFGGMSKKNKIERDGVGTQRRWKEDETQGGPLHFVHNPTVPTGAALGRMLS